MGILMADTYPTILGPVPLCGYNKFDVPQDVAFDKNGNIYVVNLFCNNTSCTSHISDVKKFTNNGSFITVGGLNGGKKLWSEIAYPKEYQLIHQWECLFDNRRSCSSFKNLLTMASFISKWGSYGNGNGQFNHPSRYCSRFIWKCICS